MYEIRIFAVKGQKQADHCAFMPNTAATDWNVLMWRETFDED